MASQSLLDRLSESLERVLPRQTPSFAKSLGVGLTFAFVLQIITGVTLGATYTPTTTDAWGSIYVLETRVLFGSFVRGLHHFGASAVVILAALHMTQVVLSGAYRRPRARNWVLGVVMLLLVMGLALTGYLLPWDQHGYWSTRVATGIIGEAPLGGLMQTLLLGGDSYGNATLSRFYTLHAFVLPGLLATLAIFHIASYLKHGPHRRGVGANDTAPAAPAMPYFPYQLVRDLVVMLVVLATLAALALALGAPLEAPADPASDYVARPEWYFMFLYQLLQFFEGPLVFVGTTVLPALVAVFLIAIPFIDRKRGETETPSRAVRFGYLGLCVVIGGLTTYAIASDLGDDSFIEARAAAHERSALAVSLADHGGVDGLGRVVLMEGFELFHDKGCANCHDDPEEPAPRLKGYGSLERAVAFLTNPDDERFFGKTKLAGEMPVPELAPEDRELMAIWLTGRSAPADRLERARKLFISNDCTLCHNQPGMSARDSAYDLRAVGPDLDGWQSYEWTRALIRDAGHPTYFGGVLAGDALKDSMPPYPDLSADELDLLTTWLIAGAPAAKL